MRKSLLLLCIVLAGFEVSAQTSELDQIRELEARREAERNRDMMLAMDSAFSLSDAGRYEDADLLFRKLLTQFKSIPSDFVFYFGKNSYHLGKFRQSLDWLNKYIQLKGTSGQYSEETIGLIRVVEEEVLKEREIHSKEAGEILSRNYEVDCGPTGKVVCPICKGTTVIIRKSYIGDNYSTCPYCNEHGLLTCAEFNRLLRGELKPRNKQPD